MAHHCVVVQRFSGVAGRFGGYGPHRTDGDRVQARERLVEHEQFRLVDERGDEFGALLVAVGEGVEAIVRPVAQPTEVDELRYGASAAHRAQRPVVPGDAGRRNRPASRARS